MKWLCWFRHDWIRVTTFDRLCFRCKRWQCWVPGHYLHGGYWENDDEG